VPIREALNIAREQNLDLIEVAPDASPPVCKIMDYGKYRYQQGKREKDAQRRQKSGEVKIIRLSPGTDDHDLATKQRQTERFLRQGHKVQFKLFFKGREVTHPEIAREQLHRLYQGVQSLATVERAPQLQGRQMIMLISPRPDMPPPTRDLDWEAEEEEDLEPEKKAAIPASTNPVALQEASAAGGGDDATEEAT
jgi:translation initiation factor IF-3